jgi:UDPglucose 6-dehydrogenase
LRTRRVSPPRRSPPAEAPSKDEPLGIVGLGHVGLATAIAFVGKGREVWGLEADPVRVRDLEAGRPWFTEEGLLGALQRSLRTGRLHVTSDRRALLTHARVIFLCLPTPSRPDGSVDTHLLEEECRRLGTELVRLPGDRVFVVKSTAPPGTAERLAQVLEQAAGARPGSVPVAVNPEFLAEGTLLKDAQCPSRIVVGASDPSVGARVLATYRGFPGERVLLGPSEAALVKYASNALLALKISFANDLAGVAERSGADVYRVLRAVGLDPRLGPHFLNAGPGFGGSCFTKDLRGLQAYARERGLSLPLVVGTLEVNARQGRHVVDLLEEALGLLAGRTVALLGLAFKAGTDDVRDSRAFPVLGELLKRGARVRLHDPLALENFQRELPALIGQGGGSSVTFCRSLSDALSSSEAALILTDWPEYREAPPEVWRTLGARLVVDARRSVPEEALQAVGVHYRALGRDPAWAPLGRGDGLPPAPGPSSRRKGSNHPPRPSSPDP